MLKHVKLETAEVYSVVSVTEEIQRCITESGIDSGICVVFTPHTTAGLTITSFWDPKGHEDIQDEMNKLIPTRVDFRHQHDTPQDASGHIKSSIMGVSVSIIIEDGKPLLGHSQGVYFMEFDGPRRREIVIKLLEGV